MDKHEYIGEYIERNKKAFKGLEYGLEYLNKVADMEAKAERKWNKLNTIQIVSKLRNHLIIKFRTTYFEGQLNEKKNENIRFTERN